jgi:hypothetical protein
VENGNGLRLKRSSRSQIEIHILQPQIEVIGEGMDSISVFVKIRIHSFPVSFMFYHLPDNPAYFLFAEKSLK